ncbi:MAG: hypothetical protein CL816_07525 [Coxiellaceae bacterium]|nr:hypothetical protein [Coxiellaceae bacterium]|tara:strand:+ start:754 stop:1104 length:351 start_codon:yes stop_codon:yes gene_type:complete
MYKQGILILLLSIVAVFFQDQLAQIVRGLLALHDLIARDLMFFFSGRPIGRVIQGIIALLAIPLVAGGLAALGFWLVKHVSMPHMMATIWVMWLVMLVIVLASGTPAASMLPPASA